MPFDSRRLIGLFLLSVLGAGNGLGAQKPETVPSVRKTQGSAAKDSELFNQLKQQAEQARQKSDLKTAVELYSQLVKLDSQWAEGWWYLGSLNYDLDQYSAAADAFQNALNHDSQNCQAWGFLGLCEYQLGQNAKALEHLTKSRQLGLDHYPEISRVVRLHQAILLTRSRQFEAALFVLNTFALEHKEANSVLDAMGMAVLRISDPLDSLSPAQREMIRRFGRAGYLAAEQKGQESFKVFEELENQYRGQPNVAYAFGTALLAHQEPEKATSYFKQELEREPNHEAALVQIAFQMIALGKFEEGIPYAKKAITVAPKNFAGYYALGRIYLYLDNLPQSIDLLQKAVQIAPTVASLHYTLSQAYQRAHRPADAAQARTQFLKLEALNKKHRGEISVPLESKSAPESSGQDR